MLISTLTWSQFFLWGYERHRSQRLSTPVTLLIFGIFGAVVLSAGLVDPAGKRWEWLDVVRSFPRIPRKIRAFPLQLQLK